MNSSTLGKTPLASALMVVTFASVILAALVSALPSLAAETPGHRLVLKDGSYQSITKYEIQGDRVRYFSAERGEWEEIPKSLIDWDATRKYEEGRAAGAAAPEAVELDKEIEAERKAADARSPQVAPGLRLPDDNGVFLLDTYQNQPQLDEIEQSGSDLNRNTASNILRSSINPLAGNRQTVELPEAHAKIQSHTAIPSLYASLDPNPAAPATAQTADQAPLSPADRFRIIRLESKNGKRIAGSIKTGVTGKTKTDERFIPATVTPLSGNWFKIAPVDPLPPGEYAVAEMITKDGMNLYVWDFGVNPNAPANTMPLNPDSQPAKSTQAQPDDLKKRENH